MNKKNILIIGVVAVIIVGGLWYVSGKNKRVSDGQMNIQQEKEGNNEKEIVKNRKNNNENQKNKELKIEDELWKEVQKNVKYKQYSREYFSINNINDGETVVLGSYHDKVGGANVFAYKYNNEWIVTIAQEAISCEVVDRLTSRQVDFIKKYIKECVQFDSTGIIRKKIEELKTEEINISNWKTYRNEELGFEVRCPEEWGVKKMKFATIWPAPVPIDCEKTPEKCKYAGVNIYSNDNTQNNTINYLNIKIVTTNEIQRKDGTYVDIIKGSEFAPGDMCLLTYIKTTNNKEKILVTTFQDKRECDKNKHSKSFDLIVNSLKSFK